MNENKPLNEQIIDISDIPAKYSATDAVLSQLQERYADFRINGAEDTDAATEADKARRRIKKLRRETEKTRKELKAPALEFGKAVDREAKRIKGVLKPIEANLEAEYNKYEKAREALKEKERAAKIERLLAAGFKFDGTYYVAGDALVHPSKIDDADEEQVARWIETGKAEIEREAQEKRKREEEERQRKAEAARLEKERAELAREKAALEKERRAIEAAKPKPDPAKPAPAPGQHTNKSQRPIHNVQQAGRVNRPAPPNGAQNSTPERDRPVSQWDAGFNALRDEIINRLQQGHLPGDKKLTRGNLTAWLQSLKPEQFKLPF